MPQLVFRPRETLVSVPPPDDLTTQQQPGTRLFAVATEALESLVLGGAVVVGSFGGPPAPPSQLPGVVVLASESVPPDYPFAGAVTAQTGPAPPLSQQQLAGTVRLAAAEPPPPTFLDGRIVGAKWGIQQPVVRPTVPALAAAEEPLPEAGRVAVDHGRRLDHLPSARAVVATAEEPPPAAGHIVAGTVGFGVPRVPARPVVAARECERPHLGAVIAGNPPPPDETPQQLPGVTRIAAAEEPPPAEGWVFIRHRPLVPSDRLPFRVLLARAEEALPADGLALYCRPYLGHPPPVQAHVLAAEAAPPADGALFRGALPLPNLAAAQLPGRVLLAWSEAPRPERGRTIIITGRLAGAAGPSLTDARPAGVFRRADAHSRVIRRLPRMSAALAYQTRTKTPDEIVALVFDFTNFPEIVAGATISSAVVSGPGGAPLTGLAAGTPAVLAAAATIDSLGNTVAAGKGVECALSGGGAGDDVIVQCAATLSTGSKAVVQGKIAVRNAV